MWEATQVIRETNGELQGENNKYGHTLALCDVKHLVFSAFQCFMSYFPCMPLRERTMRYLLLSFL